MTLRVIVCESDAEAAAHVGGPVHVAYRTFDIEAPELEAFIRAPRGSFMNRQVSGVEILPEAEP